MDLEDEDADEDDDDDGGGGGGEGGGFPPLAFELLSSSYLLFENSSL